jgi:transcription elongation factor GreB
VVDPTAQARRDQVFFGATVTYVREGVRSPEGAARRPESDVQDRDDAAVSVTIVGVDEADADRGRISWVAPVARALLGARVGDLRRLRTPGGLEEIEVVAIAYPGPP